MVACFVSVAMGTSVGTITLLVPIAAAVSSASGFDLAFCVASVMGGAMFGDNLSFISDTTIAACNGQGCEMKDKFRENFWIAFPAAVATLVIILVLSFQTEIQGHISQDYHLLQVLPYVLVLIGGIIGNQCFCSASYWNCFRSNHHACRRAYHSGGTSDQYGIRLIR